jgi:hypothetical protein
MTPAPPPGSPATQDTPLPNAPATAPVETEGWKTVEGKYLFIYLFLINACNLKVMANFTELNDRNPRITWGSCWALSQYRS